MTDLTRLKVSLTKHGAHKAYVLLRDLDADQVIANVLDKHQGIKIDHAQTRQNLSALPDDTLPQFWTAAKANSDETLRQLVFLAIVFSHHQVIEAFIKGASEKGIGEILRGEVIDGKAFTNIKNDVFELGLSTHTKTSSVGYNLRPILQNRVLGSLTNQLLALKLRHARWDGDGTVADEAIRHDFHIALVQTEDEFRSWIDGSDDEISFPDESISDVDEEVSTPDEDVSDVNDFVFTSGHRPAKETASKRKNTRKTTVAKLTHNMLQTKLYDYLSKIHGEERVGTENATGAAGDDIDAVTRIEGTTTFYEIKTNKSVRLCVREALPQLLEYCYWPNHNRANRLVVVAEAKLTKDTACYIRKLRDDFNLPIYYAQINREDGSLSDLI